METASAAKEAAEKMEPVTSAAKAADGNKAFIAALKRYATQDKIISAACKAAIVLGLVRLG